MNANPELTRAFGEIIHERRSALGFSQEKLSVVAGLDRTFVYKVERGARNPSLETIFRVAKGLGIAPEDLIAEVRRRVEEY
jgi:transcriptional regulator with XRE-family HTH domain